MRILTGIILALCAVVARAENLFVTQTGAGSQNGSSVANAWSAANFNTSGNWGVGAGKISPSDFVYLSGTFTTQLTCQGSGTDATTRITITDTPALPATIVGINGGAQDYIAVIGLEITQPSPSDTFPCVEFAGCTGWLIYGNYMHDTNGPAVSYTSGNSTLVNSTNIIRKNRMDQIQHANGGTGGSGLVIYFGDSNLVEYNTVSGGLDRVRFWRQKNVVRNNYWGPTSTADYPNTNPYPNHTDGFQSYPQPGTTDALQQLYYGRNFDLQNHDPVGGTNAHGFLIQDDNNDGFNWVLYEFNVIASVGGTVFQVRGVDSTFVFNNTWYQADFGSASAFDTPVAFESGFTSDVAEQRNNSLTNSPNSREATGFYQVTGNVSNMLHGTNHTFNYPSDAQCAYPTAGSPTASPANLTKADPLFTDRTNFDFRLGGGSPLINAGSSILVTTNSGSGSTSLTMSAAHAKRIFDGWGIADGDFIKIGSGAYVQVTAVNGSTGAVTLSATRTWSNGDTVRILGTEDVGAFPKTAGTSGSPAISSGSITSLAGSATITVSDAFNVRFCEVLVDGIPVGNSYTPSGNVFTVTWSGDGSNSHTFTAVAYGMWASQTPTVESQIFFAGVTNGSISGTVKFGGTVKLN